MSSKSLFLISAIAAAETGSSSPLPSRAFRVDLSWAYRYSTLKKKIHIPHGKWQIERPSSSHLGRGKKTTQQNMKIDEMKPSFVGREIVCEFTDAKNDSLMVVKNFLTSGLLPHNIARVLRPFLMMRGKSGGSVPSTAVLTCIGCDALICLTAGATIAVKHLDDQKCI